MLLSHGIQKFRQLILAAKYAGSGQVVDALMVLQLREPVKMLLTSPIHPVDIKVVIIWISLQSIRDQGCAVILCCIENHLPIYWSKHVASGNEEPKFKLGNFAQNWISALADIED